MMTTRAALPMCAALATLALGLFAAPVGSASETKPNSWGRVTLDSMEEVSFHLWTTSLRSAAHKHWVVPKTIPDAAIAQLEAVAGFHLAPDGQPDGVTLLKPAEGPHSAAFNESVLALSQHCAKLPKLPVVSRLRVKKDTVAMVFKLPPPLPPSKETP